MGGPRDCKDELLVSLTPEPSPQDLAAIEKAKADHKWDPPRYEFALEGGYMHMHSTYLSAAGVVRNFDQSQ